jgi:hypothetical protein
MTESRSVADPAQTCGTPGLGPEFPRGPGLATGAHPRHPGVGGGGAPPRPPDPGLMR